MKNIYVAFLSSNSKMSAFVRQFTRYKYSHVAISESPTLEKMYSFARKYKNTPFIGGFVVELPSRYFSEEKDVPVKVCAISLEDEEYDKVINRINAFKKSPDKYKYNYLSAFAYWLHRQYRKKDAYICIEFVLYALGIDEFITIRELEERLSAGVIYEGALDELVRAECLEDLSDEYFDRKSVWFNVKNVSKDLAKLIISPSE